MITILKNKTSRIAFAVFYTTACLVIAFSFSACSSSGDDSGANVKPSSENYTAIVADSIKFTETDCSKALMSSDDVLKIVDASQAKLVFRDDFQKKLIYAEFSKGDSSARFYDLNNGIDAYHPEISPDGEWVAFATTYEGWYHQSTLYVQNLRTGQLLSLENQPAVVPRWRVLDQDTVIFFMDNCTLNVYDDWPEYGNYYVRFSNGKFSTPQKIFGNGSFDDVSQDFRFAVSLGWAFIVRKLVEVNGRETYVDTVWYNGEQICNVSIARDSSLRTSFLDIGGSEGAAFVGEKYNAHKMLLVADSLGRLIQAIPAPEYTVFNYTEWLAEGEFEIGTLQNGKNNLYNDRIILIDMKNEIITEIVSGDDMWHPAFWTKK